MEKIKITSENWNAIKIMLADFLISNAFSNEKLNKQFPPLDIIYHYTSLQGLISIIESQEMYCTNNNFLNDRMEYQYGIELLKGGIKKLKENDCNLQILEMIESNIDLFLKSERYVTCFSKNGDLLSQWRAYANQGRGVAIGFDFRHFENSIYQNISGKHIEYSEQVQNDEIEELIKIIIHFFGERKEIFDWSDYSYEWLVTNAILEFLENTISHFKHPSFSEEQEYRFEYLIDGNINKRGDEKILFRANESMLIPYIKIQSEYHKSKERKSKKLKVLFSYPIRKLPIKGIIVGPSLDFSLMEVSIQELLLKNGYEGVEIKKSSIPYRV